MDSHIMGNYHAEDAWGFPPHPSRSSCTGHPLDFSQFSSRFTSEFLLHRFQGTTLEGSERHLSGFLIGRLVERKVQNSCEKKSSE